MLSPPPIHLAVRKGLATRACKVVDKDGEAWCEPECKEGAPVDPKELATLIFNDLKTTASGQVGGDVVKAVLAIKPGTTDAQKEGLAAAASAAGITIEQFIPEPVAAVLAYELGQENATDHTVVVYDLGALEAVATLVSVRSGVYRILGSVTDTTIGGEVVDKAMVDFLKKEFKKKTKMDVGDNVKANAKLLEAAVHAKKILSTGSSTALVSIESLIDGMDFQCKVMGARVNVSLSKVYRQCTGVITKLLDECGVASADVTDLVVAGGAARGKKMLTTLASFFADAETVRRHCPTGVSFTRGHPDGVPRHRSQCPPLPSPLLSSRFGSIRFGSKLHLVIMLTSVCNPDTMTSFRASQRQTS